MIDDVRAGCRRRRRRAWPPVAQPRRGSGLETELLGKKGPFAEFKTRLGGLATVDEKKAAGQAVNEATQARRRGRRGPASPS